MGRDLRWVALGALLAAPAYALYGLDGALGYLTVYLLALALSVDNLLVLALVVHAAPVPSDSRRTLVRWSFACALGARAMAPIVALVATRYLPYAGLALGALLILDASRALRAEAYERKTLRARGLLVSIALVEGWYAVDLLAAVAVTRCLPVLVAASVVALLVTRRMFASAMLWAPRFLPMRTATFVLVAAGGVLLANPRYTQSPVVMFLVVAGALAAGLYAARRRP